MARGGRSRGGWGGSSGRAGKPKGGLFGLFKPKPLGGEFKTEQDITNWFLLRGVKNIGRVEINPEPDDFLDYHSCKFAIDKYVESLSEGNYPEIWHRVHRKIIESRCGFRIDNSDVYSEK